jgi:hypothetical protein
LLLPEPIDGMIEPSAIRSPLMSCIRNSGSITDTMQARIRQVPTG